MNIFLIPKSFCSTIRHREITPETIVRFLNQGNAVFEVWIQEIKVESSIIMCSVLVAIARVSILSFHFFRFFHCLLLGLLDRYSSHLSEEDTVTI